MKLSCSVNGQVFGIDHIACDEACINNTVNFSLQFDWCRCRNRMVDLMINF